MLKRVIFLSDVHLVPGSDEKAVWLLRFLAGCSAMDAVYILGDFFDYWIGPEQFEFIGHPAIFSQIKNLSDAGVQVVFLHGNRDFLLSTWEAEIMGTEVTGDRVSLDLGGLKVYASHGDEFCANDPHYLLYRGIIRNPVTKWAITRLLPADTRRKIAMGMRRSSKEIVKRKGKRITDISLRSVAMLFHSGYDVVIVGHIHRRLRREYRIGGKKKLLITLGCWDNGASFLEYSNGRFTLH